jgi:N-acetylglutamate synthase-like GNAT family acetyltransferase
VRSVTHVVYRDHDRAEDPLARRIIATAFAGEPFAYGMFGESPIDRLAGMTDTYREWPFAERPLIAAASADQALLGVAVATLPGDCHLCEQFEDVALDSDATRGERIEHEFQLASRQAHLEAGLPPHAHIATVAIDPLLHGGGVGLGLVDWLLGQIWQSGATCAVLTCLTTRESFYRRLGFQRIGEYPDPAGPDLRCALMRLDAPVD